MGPESYTPKGIDALFAPDQPFPRPKAQLGGLAGSVRDLHARHCKGEHVMKTIITAAVLTLAALPTTAQMSNPSLQTSGHFPMVDGARYDYVFWRGPWATSTVTVRANQTWAGQAGLTAFHTTYTCNVGVSCAMDATDFYRMDVDGMRYFGGTGADPGGVYYSMMSLTSPEWMLKNPVTPGSMMSGNSYANADSWRANVMGSGNMMSSGSYMSAYLAQALETVVTPAGTFANALHVREQRGNGYTRDVWYAQGVGMIRYDDPDASALLAGYTMPNAPAQPSGVLPAMPFMPVTGMWWNPDESGSGYNIQMQHGTVVVTLYAYTTGGDPIWYLGVGRPASNGSMMTVTGTLDRYRNGQCASCTYRAASVSGSDGVFTLTFNSPSDAILSMPGGRSTRIRPMNW